MVGVYEVSRSAPCIPHPQSHTSPFPGQRPWLFFSISPGGVAWDAGGRARLRSSAPAPDPKPPDRPGGPAGPGEYRSRFFSPPPKTLLAIVHPSRMPCLFSISTQISPEIDFPPFFQIFVGRNTTRTRKFFELFFFQKGRHAELTVGKKSAPCFQTRRFLLPFNSNRFVRTVDWL